ncbi:MAG: hypothetical protein M0R76_06130 [Proteobacteria bacterium]|nr:hypothetical protein [Pseudomonadota bacterium]
MPQKRLRLGDTLLEAGLITQAILEQALAIQKERHLRLGTILLQEGFISEPQLLQALSRSLSIPWVTLWRLDIPDEVLRLVPLNVAEEFFLIPIYIRTEKSGRRALYVAMNDPSDEDAMRFVAATAGMDVRPMIAGPSDIAAAIRFYYYGEDVPAAPAETTAPVVSSTPPPVPQGRPSAPQMPPPTPSKPPAPPPAAVEVEVDIDADWEPAPETLHIESQDEYDRDDPTEKTALPPVHVEAKAMRDSVLPAEATVDRFGDSVIPAPPTDEEGDAIESPVISPPPGDREENSSVQRLSEIMAERARFADKTDAQREAERRIYGVGRSKASPKGFSLTLLDGTTLSFGDRKRKRAASDPTRSAPLTRSELLQALHDVAAGRAPTHALPAEKWQSYVAVLLKLLLDKHLVFFTEFLNELEKVERGDDAE